MSFAGLFGLGALAIIWGVQLYLRSLFGAKVRGRHPEGAERLKDPVDTGSDEIPCLPAGRFPPTPSSVGTQNDKEALRAHYRRILYRWVTTAWIVAIVVILGTVVVDSVLQYRAWQGGGVSQYLVPPYQDVTYFLFYAGKRFAAPVLIALASAIILGWAARSLNNRLGGRFIEQEEARLFALCVFLVGYPAFLFYLVFMALTSVGGSLIYTLLGKGRFPLYFTWLPVALFAIIAVWRWFPLELLSAFVF